MAYPLFLNHVCFCFVSSTADDLLILCSPFGQHFHNSIDSDHYSSFSFLYHFEFETLPRIEHNGVGNVQEFSIDCHIVFMLSVSVIDH